MVDRAIDIRISLSNYKSQSENSWIWRYGILAEVNGLSMSLIFNTLLNFFFFLSFQIWNEWCGMGRLGFPEQVRFFLNIIWLMTQEFSLMKECVDSDYSGFFVAQRFYLKNKKIQCSFKIKAFLDRIMQRNSMKYRFVPHAIVVN